MTERAHPLGSEKDMPSPTQTPEADLEAAAPRAVAADTAESRGLELQAAIGNAAVLSMQAAPGAPGGSKSAGPPASTITDDLRKKFAATVLAEAYEGEEKSIGWIYYNRVVGSGLGEAGLEASSAYRLKGDWFKVWMVALGDTTYKTATSKKEGLKDYPNLGEYVKKHGWFVKFGQPRANAWMDVLDRLDRESSKNPYKGWEGQGNLDDFNRDTGKWREARQYYYLQQQGKVKQTYVEILTRSVIFDERSIAKYFKDNPASLPKTVKKYEPSSAPKP